jgi:hypothetical protein
MAEFSDICLKHVRSRKLRPNWRIFMRHDWERFLKPGWERIMPPGSSVAADMYHQLKAERGRRWQVRAPEPTREEIAAEKAAYEEYQRKLAELRWMLADLKLDLTLQRLRAKAYKANFNPAQPRWPAGSREGGQWTDGGGGGGRINDPRVISDVEPVEDLKPGAQYAALKRPGNLPKLPKQEPPPNEKNRIVWELARSSIPIRVLLEAPKWIQGYIAEIKSYRDPPKTLEELQEAVSPKSTPGYQDQDHHIVNQVAPEEPGRPFPEERIDSAENVVRIPTRKHYEINGWYSQPNDEKPFYSLSPRDYLRGKEWSERYRIGLEALKEHGVLKR